MAAKKNAAKDLSEREQAAALVFRTVPVIGKDGKPNGKTEKVAISAEEVLDFKDHGTHVVVVTIDGHKFSSADE